MRAGLAQYVAGGIEPLKPIRAPRPAPGGKPVKSNPTTSLRAVDDAWAQIEARCTQDTERLRFHINPSRFRPPAKPRGPRWPRAAAGAMPGGAERVLQGEAGDPDPFAPGCRGVACRWCRRSTPGGLGEVGDVGDWSGTGARRPFWGNAPAQCRSPCKPGRDWAACASRRRRDRGCSLHPV